MKKKKKKPQSTPCRDREAACGSTCGTQAALVPEDLDEKKIMDFENVFRVYL